MKSHPILRHSALLFYIVLLLIPAIVTLFTFCTHYIYRTTSAMDIRFENAAFDFYIGLFSFQYRLSDSSNVRLTTIYPVEWTTVSFKTACDADIIQFGTRFNPGPLIDPIFCHPYSLWTSIKVFMCLSILFGILAVNLLLVISYIWHYNLYSDKTKNQYHILRRYYKVGIMGSSMLSLVFLNISIVMIVLFRERVQWPNHLFFEYGTLSCAGSCAVYFVGLCIFECFGSFVFCYAEYAILEEGGSKGLQTNVTNVQATVNI
ncbi:hypothetical protein BC833DRAFT_584602 [Globomyces pollinis-pini]|nr:hypothetical protein BC833DRAFT_584602 [Globomyces pollinis-pini]